MVGIDGHGFSSTDFCDMDVSSPQAGGLLFPMKYGVRVLPVSLHRNFQVPPESQRLRAAHGLTDGMCRYE